MKTNSLFWALCWVAVGSASIMQGCGGDDDDDDDGGNGGSSGSATGGSSGSATGGRAGSTSTGGRAGSSTGGTSPGGMGGEGGSETSGGAGGEGGAGDEAAFREFVCTSYCQMYKDKGCLDAEANSYTDEPDCRSECQAADWAIGDENDTSGDTVYCRYYHAFLASETSMPDELHCGHAAAEPTDVCVD
jgi:hypothetical protein